MSLLLLSGLAIAGAWVWEALTSDSYSSTTSAHPCPQHSSGTSRKRSTSRKSTYPRTSPLHRAKDPLPPAGGGWLAQCGAGNVPVGGPATVYDANETPLQLSAADELASGGEGTVYRCPSNDSFVIKLYKRDIVEDPEKQKAVIERLRDMLSIGALRKNHDIAWPQMPVYDAEKRVAGFVMRAVSGTSIGSLQGAERIRRLFPGWDRKDLALVARDFLGKMQLLANHGVLVNDFNPANFIVGKDHRVRLIDCDSYQIPSVNGGAPHIATSYFSSHVAPEILRCPSLLKQPRGPEQARFGAAIIVYQLLMCGLHPYSHKNGGMPEDNLKSGKCPLGLDSGCAIPTGWYNLLSYLPYTAMDKFIRMFRDGHGDPSVRPTLAELRKEVEKFLFVMNKDPLRKDLSPATPKVKSNTAQGPWKKKAA